MGWFEEHEHTPDKSGALPLPGQILNEAGYYVTPQPQDPNSPGMQQERETNPAAFTAAGPVLPRNPSQADILNFIRQYAQANNIQPGQMPDVTRKIVDVLRAKGLNVDYEQPDEYGRSAGIVYNGQHYKIVNGSDQWMFDTYQNAEGAPWMSGGSGGYGNMFGNSGAGGPFNPPDWNDLENYPGYQFAFEQGLRGIQNSAASKGTLLTGGTLKDIGSYLGGSLAMPAYNNYFNQALQTHETNFGNLISLGTLGKPS